MYLDNSIPLVPYTSTAPVPYISEDLPFDLFKSLYVSSNGPNFIFSPYSVICALMMLLVGSSGHTQLQLARALFGPNFNGTLLNQHVKQFNKWNQDFIFETKFLVQIGNFIYSQQELKSNYTQTIAKLLKANATLVDFVANPNSRIERINSDMSRVTNGEVSNFLSNLNDNTNLLLINTIYFHAIWYIKFNQNLTQLGQFRVNPNRVVNVMMMKQQEEYYGYQYYRNRESGLEAIKMPYDGSGQVSMVIILPPENITIHSYIRDQFNSVAFDAIFDNFREHTLSPLIIPRFKLSLKHSLKSTLRQLHIADAFESDSADFSRMTQRPVGFVNEIMQNAAIECNETGDWATWEDYGFDAVSNQAPYAQFIANRPFLFVVVSVITSMERTENNYTIYSVKQPEKKVKQFLFAGVVEDPTV